MGKPKRTAAEKAANKQRRESIAQMDEHIGEPPPYSSLPPSEQASSSNVGSGESTLISAPHFSNLDFTPSPLELPTAAECIAHLKLLHAFAKLRHEVGNREGFFGIEINLEKLGDGSISPHPLNAASLGNHQPEGVHGATDLEAHSRAPELSEEQKAALTLGDRLRDKRWTVFVNKAVDRFEKWWNTLDARSAHFPSSIRMTDFDPARAALIPTEFPTKGQGLGDKIRSMLPPLDVLMVWHSYMLNPRIYLEDCMRLSHHTLWHTPFPWELIYNSINSGTFEYDPPGQAKDVFEYSNWLQWGAMDDKTQKKVPCPKCRKMVEVPWTRTPATNSPEAIEEYLSRDTGFAGQSFREACPQCNFTIDHEKLRVAKFIDDAEGVWIDRRPLPGTILNSRGIPQMTEKDKKISSHDPFFPNRVILNMPDFRPQALRENIEHLSISALKQRFETIMTTADLIKQVNAEQYSPTTVFKESKIAVRKMLSHYWDNASPFGMDLVGAVIRQASFVQKMRKIDWLHSPAAIATMQRLIVKYHRFVRIIADNPKLTAVPTLDVDLAWHTHQLTPRTYYTYTLSETKKHLNHDDKLPEPTLRTSFTTTSSLYEKKHKTPYAECACWYCESVREPLRSAFTNRISLSSDSKPYALSTITEKSYPRDVESGNHISAHNAVKLCTLRLGAGGAGVVGEPSWAKQRRAELENLDLQYAKLCKRYQRKSLSPPTRGNGNEAYIYSAYGYPMYYPVYVPYYAMPTCEGDRYSSVGGGGGVGGGVGGGAGGGGCGGCAMGTCAPSASWGSCAGGPGTPGCKASCGGHGDAEGGCGTCGGDGGGCGGCGG